LRHAKAARTRILKKSSKLMTVKHEVMRGSRRSYITERKRFRKYVQHRPNSRDLVYFKEFGDPRIMDWRTGEYQGESGKRVRIQHQATELIHGKQLSDEAYGIPRWISQLPNVLGSREAEEVNLRFFEDNTVPPMMLLVSGGQITSKSFQQLQEILSSGGLGRERQHQIMLIEAVAKSESIDENGSVRLEVEKLTDTRQSDGLFKEYDESNQAKVQSSYRLPNTLMGKSQDVTFATANVSQFIAETQVFLPERQIHDELLNKKFINSPTGLNLKTVKLEAKGPQITNPAEIVKTLTAANVMGALTPRTAIDALNEALQLSLPQYPEKPAGYDDTDDDAEPAENGYESWMDRPIAIGLRRLQSQGRLRAEQNVTDSSTRETQETGEIQMTEPENGSE
jgi:PBSX family phage portal protein